MNGKGSVSVLAVSATLGAAYIALAPTPGAYVVPTGYRTVTVARVVDGDTFEITNRWSTWKYLPWDIRPRGLDTPEKTAFAGAKCQGEIDLGNMASAYAAQLMIKKGMKVRVSNVTHDKYGGRFDADVTFSDGTKYEDYLIKAGLARPYFGAKKSNWCLPAVPIPNPAPVPGDKP